jgi:hypothetical protein
MVFLSQLMTPWFLSCVFHGFLRTIITKYFYINDPLVARASEWVQGARAADNDSTTDTNANFNADTIANNSATNKATNDAIAGWILFHTIAWAEVCGDWLTTIHGQWRFWCRPYQVSNFRTPHG